MFGSRSFTSQVLSNTLPADKARPMGYLDPDHEVLSDLFEDGFAVLLPLLDLLNYRPRSKVEWQAGLNEVGLQVLEPFDSGQEICNNYGPRDNEACTIVTTFCQMLLISCLFLTVMLGYGFSISQNPFDHYAVGFRVPPGSPLEEARAWRATRSSKANKKSKTDDSYRYYIFNADHPRTKASRCLETSIFSQDLFDSISILSANFRELQSDKFRLTGSVFDTDSTGSMDTRNYRNLLHTLCQLRLECSSRSNLVRPSPSRYKDEHIDISPQKQQYVELYRDSQLLILETAVLLCRYCVLKAQYHHEKNADLISSALAAEKILRTSEAAANLHKLVHKTHSAIEHRTLFDFQDALGLLPTKLASKIRDAAECFRVALKGKAHSSCPQQLARSKGIIEKIRFTVLLAALRKVYSDHSLHLHCHLTSWVKDLQMWYSFSDPFWNGPTEDFLPTLETLMEVADRRVPDEKEPVMTDVWCDPRILCWAWNVQEEEGLFTDIEVLDANGGGTVSQPSKYLLCIPGGPESSGGTKENMEYIYKKHLEK